MRAERVIGEPLILDGSVDLRQVALVLWRNKWLIFFCSFGGFVLASLMLRLMVPTYTTTMRLAPPQISVMQSDNSFGGLAALAGADFPSSDAISPFALYVAGIQSRETADALSRNHVLLRKMFASEWDSEAEQWQPTRSLPGSIAKFGRQLLGIVPKPWHVPDAARLQKYLIEQVVIEEDRKQPIITISFQHRDPAFSVYFLQSLHSAVDERLRHITLQRTAAYIDYLSKKLNAVSVPEYRAGIVQMLSIQERMRMMASANQPFAAEQIERPTASIYPTKPSGLLILLAGLALGAFLGATIALVRAAFLDDHLEVHS